MTRLALLIGVSEYGDGLNPLPGSELDVDALARVLANPAMGEFSARDITVLKNPSPQDMKEAIYKLFNNRNLDDLLLFYFSGHGIKDDANNLHLGTCQTRKEKDGKLYKPSAFPATYIHECVEDSRSKHQVLILDCCYSGAVAQGMTVKDAGIIDLNVYLGGKGRAILTSSTATEYSFGAEVTKDEQSGLSIYTRYLVEGIETGAADLDGDGLIGVEELHQYTSKRVKEAAPAMNPKFYPVEEGGSIYVAKSPQDDLKLKYRKEVEKRVIPPFGKLSSVAVRLLASKRQEWNISVSEAQAIQNEVLQPYREYQHNLEEYREALIEAIAAKYPFSVEIETDLKDYQQQLRLRDEDIVEIEAGVLLVKLEPLTKIEFTSVELNAQGEIIAKPSSEAEIFTEDLGNGVSLTMVKIPAGKFMMGSPESEKDRLEFESPQHQVSVPEFYMGQTLVTQAQWQFIMGRNPSVFKGNDKLPVEQVSWLDSMCFCHILSHKLGRTYRLPSEAEWEYACRAGTITPFVFGETITPAVVNFNCDGNYTCGGALKGEYRHKTTLVKSFPPNLFGLYDMHGNLWEWCLDEWVEIGRAHV